MQDSQSGSIHTRQYGVRGGSLTVAQAKSMLGVKADKDDDIYLPTPGMVEVPIGLTVADVKAENQLLIVPNRAGGKLR